MSIMRIHTSTVTGRDLYDAANRAGKDVHVDFTSHGSRTHGTSYDVTLTGTSGRRQNSGRYGAVIDSDEHAATWDEWGMFLAHLFDVDPAMRAGGTVKRPVYDEREDFHAQTGGRFEDLTPDEQHRNHRWTFVSVGHFTCKCGADHYPMLYR